MNYPENIEKKIGFDTIRLKLTQLCLSNLGKALVEKMQFTDHYIEIKLRLRQTAEFKSLLQENKEFPVDNYHDLRPELQRLLPDGMYPEAEIVLRLKKSLQTMRSIEKWFKGEYKEKYPELSNIADSFKIFPYLFERIDRIITNNGRIKDNASRELHNIRQYLDQERSRVSKLINTIHKEALSQGHIDEDAQVTICDGRLMLPVKNTSRRKIPGIVHDESATGKTVFIEPQKVIEINNEIRDTEHKEKREIIKILREFANDLRPYIPDLIGYYDKLAMFDFIRAKALFATEINAIEIPVDKHPGISYQKAINPLLHIAFKGTTRKVISNNIILQKNQRILLISGPNAGGKSVAMKTAGILQYMLQCGLLVPVSQDSSAGIFKQIHIDIGDDQSIDNDLSTYSSHLLHMKQMLKRADEYTLILIDEFGSGTEPLIGGAIAEAMLEQFKQSGTFGVITTHYSNLKHFAANNEGLINGAMLFNTAKIEPIYKLETGKPGSSFAIEIAHKIGLPKNVINDAHKRAGSGQADFDKHLREIMRDKKYYEEKRTQIKKQEKNLEKLLEQQGYELEKTKKIQKEILQEAEIQAKTVLDKSNKLIEKTIRDIKEVQADKEKTKQIRAKFNTEKEALKNQTPKEKSRIEKRIDSFKNVSKKHKVNLPQKEIEQKKQEIQIGDPVKIIGQNSVGELIEINEKNAIVAFGAFITSVSRDKLERTNHKALHKKEYTTSLDGQSTASRMLKKQQNFKSGIDLRGKYVDEALREITDYIDEAIVLNAREIKILHGKGNGILRKAIREYLSTIPEINCFHDEQVEFGGAGITVVEFK